MPCASIWKAEWQLKAPLVFDNLYDTDNESQYYHSISIWAKFCLLKHVDLLNGQRGLMGLDLNELSEFSYRELPLYCLSLTTRICFLFFLVEVIFEHGNRYWRKCFFFYHFNLPYYYYFYSLYHLQLQKLPYLQLKTGWEYVCCTTLMIWC